MISDDGAAVVGALLHRLAAQLEDPEGAPKADLEPPTGLSGELGEALRRLAEAVAAARRRPDRATCDLVSRLAHEMRTPLGSLLMTAELLGTAKDEGRMRDLARRLGIAGRELRATLESTVELVKTRDGRWPSGSPVDLPAEEVREIVEEAGLTEGGPFPTIRLAAGDLRGLLGPLGEAARCADPAGPPPVLSIRTRPDGGLTLSVPFPGASEEWLQPFARSAQRGVGLELARTRALARHLGGDLRLRLSDDPAGAVLELLLPLGPNALPEG